MSNKTASDFRAPKRYLPFAASPSKRPLIPEAPVPKIRPIARSVRDLMGAGEAPVLSLGARAYFRIRAAMHSEDKAELATKLLAAAVEARSSGRQVEVEL